MVERQLPKLNVAGSNPVSRSIKKVRMIAGSPVFMRIFAVPISLKLN